MSMSKSLDNIRTLHTYVRTVEREYLNHLVTIPGLTKTATVHELLSAAAAEFLHQKPWLHDPENDASLDRGFTWIQPGTPKLHFDGELLQNGDLVPYMAKVGDVTWCKYGGIRSEDIARQLKSLAQSAAIPSLGQYFTHGSGQNTTVYTMILWTIHNLYPPSVFSPTSGYAALLESSRRVTTKHAEPPFVYPVGDTVIAPALKISHLAHSSQVLSFPLKPLQLLHVRTRPRPKCLRLFPRLNPSSSRLVNRMSRNHVR